MHNRHQFRHFGLQRFDGFLVDFDSIRLFGRFDLQKSNVSEKSFSRKNWGLKIKKQERSLGLTSVQSWLKEIVCRKSRRTQGETYRWNCSRTATPRVESHRVLITLFEQKILDEWNGRIRSVFPPFERRRRRTRFEWRTASSIYFEMPVMYAALSSKFVSKFAS